MTTIADQRTAKGTERLKAAISQATTPLMQDDLEIFSLSAKCSKLAEGLLAELGKLRLEQSGLRQAIKKGFRSILRKTSLKEKQELLEGYQRVLDTRILMRLDTRSLKEMQNFQNLDQSVKELVVALEQGRNTVAHLLAGHSRTIQDHIDKKFEGHEQKSAKSLAHERLLNSLFFPEILSRQDRIPVAFEGTCHWIFEPPTGKRQWSNFRDWLEVGDDIYWISGKPGSGKSTLMKHIVSEELTSQLLNNWKKNNEIAMVSFFFWNAGTDLQKNATGLLRSLLYQLAVYWPDLVDLAGWNSGTATGTVTISQSLHHLAEWTDQRLLSVLKRLLDQKPKSLSICAFVDGLDEFIGDEELLLDIVRIFGDASQCKICVSSRPEQAFRQDFRLCPQLRVQDLNHDDMERTVTGELSPHLKKYSITDEVRNSLVNELMDKAQGVFLWLDLMIKILIKGLRNGDTYEKLHSRLEKTPDTIDGIYTHILKSLDPLYQEESTKYFSVLLAAKDLNMEISLLDLVNAGDEPWEHVTQFDLGYFKTAQFDSACRHLETRIVACCGGLVDIQENQNGCRDEDSETEDIEDENSEDEKSEDDGSDDRYAITWYNPKVDFIHKTAMEYVRAPQQSSPLGNSDTQAKFLLARGVIGRLVFFSLMNPGPITHYNQDLTTVIIDVRTTIIAIDEFGDTPNGNEALVSTMNDMTGQLFQSLQNLYTLHHRSEQDFFTDAPFLHTILDTHVYGIVRKDQFLAWCQVRDRLSGAAFFGFYHYVQFQLSMHSIPHERVLNLPQAVISGFEETMMYPHLYRYSIFSRLLILRSIQRYLDPNKQYTRRPFDKVLILNATLWGATWALIMRALDLQELDGFSDSTRLRFQSCVTDLVETFLSSGANPNTRTVLYLFVENHRLIVEESPLALIEYWARKDANLLSEIQAHLNSVGAVNQRRFLFISKRFGQSFYRLSLFQSERLIGVMRSSWRKESSAWGSFLVWRQYRHIEESDDMMITEIVDSFAEEDGIEEETALDEIKALGESF